MGGDSKHRSKPGNFIAPHGLALDSRGDLYVAEVSSSFGDVLDRMPIEECLNHQIQKFRRIR